MIANGTIEIYYQSTPIALGSTNYPSGYPFSSCSNMNCGGTTIGNADSAASYNIITAYNSVQVSGETYTVSCPGYSAFTVASQFSLVLSARKILSCSITPSFGSVSSQQLAASTFTITLSAVPTGCYYSITSTIGAT